MHLAVVYYLTYLSIHIGTDNYNSAKILWQNCTLSIRKILTSLKNSKLNTKGLRNNKDHFKAAKQLGKQAPSLIFLLRDKCLQDLHIFVTGLGVVRTMVLVVPDMLYYVLQITVLSIYNHMNKSQSY